MQKRFPDGVPLLDPIDDMGIKDPALKKVIQKLEAFEHRMYSHPLHSDPNLESVYSLCEKKALVRRGRVCVFVCAKCQSLLKAKPEVTNSVCYG